MLIEPERLINNEKAEIVLLLVIRELCFKLGVFCNY